jgi:hypothetical protein
VQTTTTLELLAVMVVACTRSQWLGDGWQVLCSYACRMHVVSQLLGVFLQVHVYVMYICQNWLACRQLNGSYGSAIWSWNKRNVVVASEICMLPSCCLENHAP